MKAIFTLLPVLWALPGCGETTQSEGLFSSLKDGQTHYERLAEVYESAGMPDEVLLLETKYLPSKIVDMGSQNVSRDTNLMIYQAGDPVVGLETYVREGYTNTSEEDAATDVRNKIASGMYDPTYADANLNAWVSKTNYPSNQNVSYFRSAVIAGSTYLVSKAVCEEEAGCEWRHVNPAYKEAGYYTYTKL